MDWGASSLLRFDLLGNGLDDLESTGRVLDYMRPWVSCWMMSLPSEVQSWPFCACTCEDFQSNLQSRIEVLLHLCLNSKLLVCSESFKTVRRCMSAYRWRPGQFCSHCGFADLRLVHNKSSLWRQWRWDSGTLRNPRRSWNCSRLQGPSIG